MEKSEKEWIQMVQPLLLWYKKNARVLPWRETTNPYYIWISEIMLQQTRVETVKPYYERFIETLPSIKDLAEVGEEKLLKLWEGLGYYNRVRNLQKAAQQVMEKYNGALPADYDALRGLKGIGPYTAGAIASIAFALPYAAIDGNVLRVMARITADEREIALASTKKFWEDEILAILPEGKAGEYNQALMELGATICLPNGQPKCPSCPLRELCEAYRLNKTSFFPIKSEKKPRTIEEKNVFFITDGFRIALKKRENVGLLAGLWELPNCPRKMPVPKALQGIGLLNGELSHMKGQKHIFTHKEWHMDCYFIKANKSDSLLLEWVKPEEMVNDYTVPSAFQKIWQEGLKKMYNIKLS